MIQPISALTLNSQLAAVDITDTHVVVAEGQLRDEQPEISQLGIAVLPSGADARTTVGVLKRLLRKSHIRRRRVASCFRGRGLMLKHFQYPGLKRDELASALRLEAEETLQVSPRDIHMDWHVTHAGPGDTVRPVEGILAAVVADQLEEHLDILRAASLVPALVDVGCTAIASTYRAFSSPEPGGTEAVGLVHLAGHRADIALLYGSDRLYPRSLSSPTVAWASVPDALAEHLQEAIMYFRTKVGAQPLDRLLLSGVIPEPAEVSATIQARVGLPVEPWNPLAQATLRGPAARLYTERPEATPVAAACVGLALRSQ